MSKGWKRRKENRKAVESNWPMPDPVKKKICPDCPSCGESLGLEHDGWRKCYQCGKEWEANAE